MCRHSSEIRLGHNFEKFGNYLGRELVSVRCEWRKYKHPHCSWPSCSKVSGIIPSHPSSAALEHPLLPLAVRNIHNTPWSSFPGSIDSAWSPCYYLVLASVKQTQIKSSSNFIEASIVVSFYYYATRLYWLLFLWEV